VRVSVDLGILLVASTLCGGVRSRTSILLVSRTEVMINRDSRGHSYSTVRGEILGFVGDELLRKHLPRMFSLIKNES
jgi:hypothetical protein